MPPKRWPSRTWLCCVLTPKTMGSHLKDNCQTSLAPLERLGLRTMPLCTCHSTHMLKLIRLVSPTRIIISLHNEGLRWPQTYYTLILCRTRQSGNKVNKNPKCSLCKRCPGNISWMYSNESSLQTQKHYANVSIIWVQYKHLSHTPTPSCSNHYPFPIQSPSSIHSLISNLYHFLH